MPRYLSWRRGWPNTVMLGFALGLSPDDKSICLMLHFFTHVLIIGPHLSGR